MPNYSLVIGSKFRPLSYQEMLAPVLQQTQAHQEIEQAYAALNAEADKIKDIALEEPDSKVAARYLKYSDDLKANAAVLAMKGLDANSRQGMYDLNARYQSDIVPIQTAYTRKMQEVADQVKGGNNMRYSYDARTRSLDDYVDKPSETYQAFNLEKPYQDAAQEMSQISKVLMDIKHGRFDAYTKTYKELYGLNKDEAAELADAIRTGNWENVSKDNKGTAFIKNVAEKIFNNYKQDWGEDSTINQEIWNQIARGTSFALGQDKINTYTDHAAVARASGKDKEETSTMYNPLALRSKKELTDNNKEIQKYISKGYIKQNENGGYALTNKGLHNMYTIHQENIGGENITRGVGSYGNIGRAMSAANSGGSSAITPTYKVGKTTFGKWFTNIYGEELIDEKASKSSGQLKYKNYKGNTALNNYIDYNKEGSYDTYHSTEYDIKIDNVDRDDVKNHILSNTLGDKINIVDFDASDGKGKWVSTGKISKNDLEGNDGYEVISVRPSKYGDTAILKKKKSSEIIRVEIPSSSMNPTADIRTRQAFERLEAADDFLNDVYNLDNNEITEDVINAYNEALQIKQDALDVIHTSPLDYWRQSKSTEIKH